MSISLNVLDTLEQERERLRAGWRSSGVHGGLDFADAVVNASVQHGHAELRFMAEGHSAVLTIAELLDESARLATVLAELGIRPGDSVALHLPSWPETTELMVAALFLRVSIVPIPAIYGPAEVTFILEDAGISTYFVAERWRSHDYLAGLDEVTRASTLERVVVVGESVPEGCLSYTDLKERARSATAMPVGLHRGPGSARAFVVYTSGSTSNPKGGQHSSDTMLAEFEQNRVQFSRPGRFLEGFPAGHMGGLMAVLRPLLFGHDTILLDHWDAQLAASMVHELSVTQAMGPPFYLTTLLDEAEAGNLDLSSIRDFSTGGTGVASALIERADAAGFHPYRTYGSTEHPTITSGFPSDSLLERSRSDGALLPLAEVKVVDDDEQLVPPGTEGQLLSRGPDQFLGYTDPAANLEAFAPGGWFRTGDLGIMEGSRLSISGRKKDVIIRGGENLSSEEIEDILMRHPSVSHVAVVGAKDPLYGERACAFVVLRPGASLSMEQMRAHFREARVARQKTPELLVVRDELPRTAAGKVRKNDLRTELDFGQITFTT